MSANTMATSMGRARLESGIQTVMYFRESHTNEARPLKRMIRIVLEPKGDKIKMGAARA